MPQQILLNCLINYLLKTLLLDNPEKLFIVKNRIRVVKNRKTIIFWNTERLKNQISQKNIEKINNLENLEGVEKLENNYYYIITTLFN